jgi:hypothetical protein
MKDTLARGEHLPEGFHYLRVHAGPGRVGNDNIGKRLRGSSHGLANTFFQISRQKLTIAQTIESAINQGIPHGFRHQFKSHDLTNLRGQREPDAASAAIEIPEVSWPVNSPSPLIARYRPSAARVLACMKEWTEIRRRNPPSCSSIYPGPQGLTGQLFLNLLHSSKARSLLMVTCKGYVADPLFQRPFLKVTLIYLPGWHGRGPGPQRNPTRRS